RDYAARHDRFHREATEVFAKWRDKAVWKPYLWPTVNVSHLMTDGASPELRRTIIPRSVHARLDIRLTPDTPLAAMVEIVERAAARRRRGDRLVAARLGRTRRRLPGAATTTGAPRSASERPPSERRLCRRNRSGGGSEGAAEAPFDLLVPPPRPHEGEDPRRE